MTESKSPVILTIDDDKYIRESFRGLLEDFDFEVLEAENGRIGLEIFEKENPDLILVDMRMPVVDGLEVLETVVKKSPDTPIIMVSGAGEIKDVVKALRLGAWDYLMKPVKDLNMLAHTIERSLERHRLIKENREYQEHLEDKVVEQTKKIEKTNLELQKSEKHFRTIVETSREGIWIIDLNKKTTFVTLRMAEMFGYNTDEMLGKEATVFVDPSCIETFEELNERLLSGEGGQCDLKFRQKDGSELWGIVSTNPIFDADGAVTSGFEMIMDITERKQAEEELARHRDHLEELVKERTEELERTHKELVEKAHKAGMADIATGIVHNVGNVLNSVKTSVQVIDNILKESLIINFKRANDLLRENMDTLEEFLINNSKGKMLMEYYLRIEEGLSKEHFQIEELTNRLIRMVDAIADIISAQQNYTNVDFLVEKSSLDKTVDDALTMMIQLITNQQVIVKRIYNKIPQVEIQKIKLLHTIINIIKNACESMENTQPDNRILTIVIDYCEMDKNAACIKMSDTGHGIHPENLEKIFSYGFTTKSGRHGLGLHSSANYMTEMGGKLWAENNESGKGTSFILKFRIPTE